jgi:hypothetical protein
MGAVWTNRRWIFFALQTEISSISFNKSRSRAAKLSILVGSFDGLKGSPSGWNRRGRFWAPTGVSQAAGPQHSMLCDTQRR